MIYSAARMAYLWPKNEYQDLGGELVVGSGEAVAGTAALVSPNHRILGSRRALDGYLEIKLSEDVA